MERKKISVAIPASVVSDVPHLREKTQKIGIIGRAAAIFGVEEIIIYSDQPSIDQKGDIELISTLLNYMETPQYLRKKLFKIKPELRYAGILPPLRTPHHPLGSRARDLRIGEYREGVVFSRTGDGVLVDIGVEKPALIPRVRIPLGRRVTVKIVSLDKQVLANLVNRKEIPDYWGYSVTVWDNSFGKLVLERKFDLKVATSKHGIPFERCKDPILRRWMNVKTILIAFGSPTQGLYEIAKLEGLKLDEIVDFVVNMIPDQKTETVRTEEAIIASLAVFKVSLGF